MYAASLFLCRTRIRGPEKQQASNTMSPKKGRSPARTSTSSFVDSASVPMVEVAPSEPKVQGAPVAFGVGGMRIANPYFGLPGEDGIRHEHPWCCSTYRPGPNIPIHWFDGGAGWVTKYFYEVSPYDAKTYEPGVYRCQVPMQHGHVCNHEVAESDCCKGTCCWSTGASAHLAMREHVMSAHGQVPPPKREWATSLFDTEGCCEALFCTPCHGSRQMMALAGWEDEFHWGWCLFFTFLGFRKAGSGRNSILYWIPPCIYVAGLTRFRMVALNNIDEGICTTICMVACCSLCSVAQTYRELSAAGVWTGTIGCSQRPENYASVGQPKPTLAALMI